MSRDPNSEHHASRNTHHGFIPTHRIGDYATIHLYGGALSYSNIQTRSEFLVEWLGFARTKVPVDTGVSQQLFLSTLFKVGVIVMLLVLLIGPMLQIHDCFNDAPNLDHDAVWGLDPTRPMGSMKTAWVTCRKAAGVWCRLHDLRHTFISALGEAGVPESTLKAIAGLDVSQDAGAVFTHQRSSKVRSRRKAS